MSTLTIRVPHHDDNYQGRKLKSEDKCQVVNYLRFYVIFIATFFFEGFLLACGLPLQSVF